MAYPLKVVDYSDPQKLKLHVYVVGYPVEGESILVIVAEDNKPLLTLVTDCYEGKDKYNHVAAILRDDWNTPSLDAFIWTHPHRDHSLGITTLINQFDSERKAHIVAPTNVVGFHHYDDIWVESIEIQKFLIDAYPSKTFQYHYQGYDPYEDCKLDFLLKGSNQQCPDLNLTLDFIAPVPSLVARYMNNKKCKPNKGSLAFLLSINGIDVFMGGDLDEECVPFIDDDVYSHVNLIKIPHHGSEHTGDIHLKFGMNECDEVHAVTTVFTKCADPKNHIMQGYLDNGAIVHCTGPRPGNIPADGYGCLHYKYNIATSRLESMTATGNTYVYP